MLQLKSFWGALALAVAILAAPLAAGAQDGRPMILPVDNAPLIVSTDEGERRFSVEIADNERNRARGLMFRNTMPDDRGMLFVFERTRPLSFWMRNTPMPLDLVFIGQDGLVIDTLPGEPFSDMAISPGVPSRFVLELKRGIAAQNGIKAGDRVRHRVIDAVAGGG